MDEWGREQLEPWSEVRLELPVGPLFCVVNGATRGRAWSAAAARTELRHTATAAGLPRSSAAVTAGPANVSPRSAVSRVVERHREHGQEEED